MVSRRELIGRILGAGASLVAMVIGSKSESREADPTSWSFGLEKGTTKGPAFRKKGAGTSAEANGIKGMTFRDCCWHTTRITVKGSGPAFHRLLDEWGREGVWDMFKKGEEWPIGSGNWLVAVILDRKLTVLVVGDGLALFAEPVGGVGTCASLGTLERLRASGVAFVIAEGLSIDLT